MNKNIKTIEVEKLIFKDINEAIILLNAFILFSEPKKFPEVLKLIETLKEVEAEQLKSLH